LHVRDGQAILLQALAPQGGPVIFETKQHTLLEIGARQDTVTGFLAPTGAGGVGGVAEWSSLLLEGGFVFFFWVCVKGGEEVSRVE